MSALPVQSIFAALHDAGLSVSLASGCGLIVSPGSRLTPDLRELVKGNKAALLNYLQAANDPDANSRLGEIEITKLPFLDEWLCPTKAAHRRVAADAPGRFFRCRKPSRLSHTPRRAT
jgi:hypothetical protein